MAEPTRVSPMILSYVCLGAAILLGIGGQIALKSAADGSVSLITQVANPLTVVGFAIYIFSALCYIVALKEIPVSVAFPSVSASYGLVAVLAHVLWNEPLGLPQIAGLALIGSGVVLIHQY